MSKSKNTTKPKTDNDALEEEETPSVVEVNEIDEGEDVAEPVTVIGTVATRLNIRENGTGSSDTAVVTIVEAGEELTVFIEEGTPMFFKVKTKNGVEGYAMRRFVILDADTNTPGED